MWELLKDFLLVSVGTGIGVALMCILSVVIKRTELGAYGDCGYRYLLRVQA